MKLIVPLHVRPAFFFWESNLLPCVAWEQYSPAAMLGVAFLVFVSSPQDQFFHPFKRKQRNSWLEGSDKIRILSGFWGRNCISWWEKNRLYDPSYWKVLKYRSNTESIKSQILEYESIAERDNVWKLISFFFPRLKCCIISVYFSLMDVYTENVIFKLPWWKNRGYIQWE